MLWSPPVAIVYGKVVGVGPIDGGGGGGEYPVVWLRRGKSLEQGVCASVGGRVLPGLGRFQ